MPKVVVIGDTDADFYYLIDHIPTWDEGVLVSDSFYKPGGKGANTASVISNFGIDTGIISVVGNDENGRKGVIELKKNNVNIDGMIIVDGHETYHCIVMLDKTGEKALLVRTTDIVYPFPEHFIEKEEYLCSAEYAHFIAINPLLVLPPIIAAKKKGVKISIDLDAAYSGLDACRDVIANSDIILINRQGAQRLFPKKTMREIVRELIIFGPSTVIITLGCEGVVAGCSDGSYFEVPAYNVKVVDTSGSGDTFSAAIVYCAINHMNLLDSLEFASAAAAISVEGIGAQSSMPTIEAVKRLLRKRR